MTQNKGHCAVQGHSRSTRGSSGHKAAART